MILWEAGLFIVDDDDSIVPLLVFPFFIDGIDSI